MDWLEILGWDEEVIADLRSTGYSYIKQGIYDIALQYYEALTILDPQNTYDIETIGALHLQMGKGKQALDFLNRSLKENPENLDVQLNRAKALFMLGYRRQGLLQAMELQKCSDPQIASQASALVYAYGEQ